MKNNVEIIKGIDLMIKGLNTIKEELVGGVKTDNIVELPKKEESEPIVEKVEEVVEEKVEGKFDVEKLSSMKYNEFKKFAASLGVKCTGTRAEIMERILALEVTAEVVEPEVVENVEEVVEETPVVEEKPKKKLNKKEVEEVEKDEFDEQAEAIAEETDVEDIIEALADVDIKATKKNAVQKLAEALRDGLIELDEEDEDEEVEETDEVEEAEVEEAEEEFSADSYFSEYDPKGYNNPKGMSEERAEAIEAKVDEIITAYEEEELTDEEIASYIEDNATEEEIELLGEEYTEEDILKLYIELVKRTIDNDGEEHEQGEPYEVADKDVCCGHELNYVKKTQKYICEHCGTEYEAE